MGMAEITVLPELATRIPAGRFGEQFWHQSLPGHRRLRQSTPWRWPSVDASNGACLRRPSGAIADLCRLAVRRSALICNAVEAAQSRIAWVVPTEPVSSFE